MGVGGRRGGVVRCGGSGVVVVGGGGLVVSLPTYGVRVGNPHDLDLHRVAIPAVVSEFSVGFGGFEGGSDLLLDDGGGDGIICDFASFDEGVDGGLVAIDP